MSRPRTTQASTTADIDDAPQLSAFLRRRAICSQKCAHVANTTLWYAPARPISIRSGYSSTPTVCIRALRISATSAKGLVESCVHGRRRDQAEYSKRKSYLTRGWLISWRRNSIHCIKEADPLENEMAKRNPAKTREFAIKKKKKKATKEKKGERERGSADGQVYKGQGEGKLRDDVATHNPD